MKRLCIFLVVLLAAVPSAFAQRFPVTVVGVSDGDTFTVINRDKLQLRIRVYGIDAPEKGQAFGNRAKQALSSYIAGREIEIDVQSQEKWGRFVARVYTPEGEDVALLMLRDGMAWHYAHFGGTAAYKEAQEAARAEKAGLWADPAPVAPWDFRKKAGSGQQESRML